MNSDPLPIPLTCRNLLPRNSISQRSSRTQSRAASPVATRITRSGPARAPTGPITRKATRRTKPESPLTVTRSEQKKRGLAKKEGEESAALNNNSPSTRTRTRSSARLANLTTSNAIAGPSSSTSGIRVTTMDNTTGSSPGKRRRSSASSTEDLIRQRRRTGGQTFGNEYDIDVAAGRPEPHRHAAFGASSSERREDRGLQNRLWNDQVYNDETYHDWNHDSLPGRSTLVGGSGPGWVGEDEGQGASNRPVYSNTRNLTNARGLEADHPPFNADGNFIDWNSDARRQPFRTRLDSFEDEPGQAQLNFEPRPGPRTFLPTSEVHRNDGQHLHLPPPVQHRPSQPSQPVRTPWHPHFDHPLVIPDDAFHSPVQRAVDVVEMAGERDGSIWEYQGPNDPLMGAQPPPMFDWQEMDHGFYGAHDAAGGDTDRGGDPQHIADEVDGGEGHVANVGGSLASIVHSTSGDQAGSASGPSSSTSRSKASAVKDESPDDDTVTIVEERGTVAGPSSSTLTSNGSSASTKQKQKQKAKQRALSPEPEYLSSYNCPICFFPPTNATMTPCGHICCGQCLFAAVKSTMARNRTVVAGPQNRDADGAKCPVCRATIPGWDGRGGGVMGLKIKAVFSL